MTGDDDNNGSPDTIEELLLLFMKEKDQIAGLATILKDLIEAGTIQTMLELIGKLSPSTCPLPFCRPSSLQLQALQQVSTRVRTQRLKITQNTRALRPRTMGVRTYDGGNEDFEDDGASMDEM